MIRFVDEEFLAFLKAEYPETVPTQGRRALGMDDLPNKRFDTIIQGRNSYDLTLKEGITSPYAHLREYVASRTLKESPDPNVEIIADDLAGKVRELKAEEGGLGIYLCGGSKVAGELFDEIDGLVIKTYPLVYGMGMPVFGSGFAISEFALESVRTFGNGAPAQVQQEALSPRPAYSEDMGSEEQVCPDCGQPVETVVRRHKTLGAWVPRWEAGPCRNPECGAYEAEDADSGHTAEGIRPAQARTAPGETTPPAMNPPEPAPGDSAAKNL